MRPSKGIRVRHRGSCAIDGFRVHERGARICKTPLNQTGRMAFVRNLLVVETLKGAKGEAQGILRN